MRVARVLQGGRGAALFALSLVACGSPKDGDPKGSAAGTGAVQTGTLQTGILQTGTLPTGAPRGDSARGADSGPVGSTAPAKADPPSTPPPGEDEEPPGPPAQAERRTVKAVADDPAIDANRDFIADHWGVVQLPFPLELQTAKLPRSQRALLLTGQGPALDKPLVLVVGRENTILWSKPKPLAGTHERARELTIARGPRGHVMLFLYDEPSKVLAGRAWTHEGGIFADFQVITAETCDAASVLYWPGRGWVAALLSEGTLHVQLLGEAGTLVFPNNGLEIPAASGPSAAAKPPRPKIAIADDTIEIAVGARKFRISREGALLR